MGSFNTSAHDLCNNGDSLSVSAGFWYFQIRFFLQWIQSAGFDMGWNSRITENFSGYYFGVDGTESGESGNPRSVFFLFGEVTHHILIFARVPASACALQKKKNLRCGCLFLFWCLCRFLQCCPGFVISMPDLFVSLACICFLPQQKNSRLPADRLCFTVSFFLLYILSSSCSAYAQTERGKEYNHFVCTWFCDAGWWPLSFYDKFYTRWSP